MSSPRSPFSHKALSHRCTPMNTDKAVGPERQAPRPKCHLDTSASIGVHRRQIFDSPRNTGRVLDMHGFESGSDSQAPLGLRLKLKAPRGGAEENRGSRRKAKNTLHHTERSDPSRFSPPRSSLVLRASALNFFAAVCTATGPCSPPSHKCVKNRIFGKIESNAGAIQFPGRTA